MTIGQLARRAGVSVETVRYYQRRGLLAEPPLPGRGFRRYTEETLTTLRFLRRLKGLGFTLREIALILALRSKRAEVRPSLVAMLRDKEAQLERKIHDLQVIVHALGDVRAAVLGATGDAVWRPLDPP